MTKILLGIATLLILYLYFTNLPKKAEEKEVWYDAETGEE